MMSKDYERISPTAWFIAEGRSFTDIPYSKEILAAMGKVAAPPERLTAIGQPVSFARFEARFKMVNRFLRAARSTQILELASGLSPRGLSMTDDPTITYVEVDLPSMIKQKKEVLSVVKPELPKNLHLEVGNALRLDDLKTAARHFSPEKPIAIVHEGFLRYLTFDEKKTVARNVSELLARFGGVWITPDVTLSNIIYAEGIVEQTKRLTGVDITLNAFGSVDEAKRFYEALGFTVEAHSFHEISDELTSPANIGLSKDAVDAILESGYVFVMRKSR